MVYAHGTKVEAYYLSEDGILPAAKEVSPRFETRRFYIESEQPCA